MLIPLDEVVYFDVVTHDPSTGTATDADSTPTFAVYEESTDTDIGVGGNLTKRTSLTGDYRGTFTASAANGFEAGKWYSVIASATVNGIAGKAVAMHFRCVPAEAVAGVPKVDTGYFAGQTITCAGGVTVPAATLASTTNITAAIGVTVSTVSDKTGYSLAAGSFVTATFGTCDFTSTQKASITTAVPTVANILTTAMTESYATDGSTMTLAQGLYMLWSRIAEPSISGTTMTTKKLDGSTTAMTFTLNSSSAPTSYTRAT